MPHYSQHLSLCELVDGTRTLHRLTTGLSLEYEHWWRLITRGQSGIDTITEELALACDLRNKVQIL